MEGKVDLDGAAEGAAAQAKQEALAKAREAALTAVEEAQRHGHNVLPPGSAPDRLLRLLLGGSGRARWLWAARTIQPRPEPEPGQRTGASHVQNHRFHRRLSTQAQRPLNEARAAF